MKITIVLGAFLPVPPSMGGAVEKVWFALAPEFAKQGHEVTMISRAMAGLPASEVRDGVRHIRVRGFNTPRALWWLKFLDLIYSRRAKRVLPPADILVTNTFWLPVLVKDLRHGRIYVHVARFPKGQMGFYKNAARLQTPSSSVADAIIEQEQDLAGKVKVVPYPAPAALTAGDPPPLTSRPKQIIYVGRLHPEKGVDLLVGVFADSARTLFAGWRLMIVGPAEERFGGGGEVYLNQLRLLAKPAGEQVTFAGPIFDPAELERTLRSSRLFVYPSLAERGETFGLAPLEAMKHGCAVLVSDLACFRDFVEEGKTGFIFDHRAPEAHGTLGRALHHLTTNEDLLARVAAGGHGRSADYSLARVAGQFLDDFSSLTDDVRTAGR